MSAARTTMCAAAVFAVLSLLAPGPRPGLALSGDPAAQATVAEEIPPPPAPAFLKGGQQRWWPEIRDAARRARVDEVAWAAIVSLETAGNPAARGKAAELGLSQYQPWVARQIGPHCIEGWDDAAINLRCGAAWFERVRRPFEAHGSRNADLLGMIAYHSGMLVYDSERALLRGADPCDWTDRAYCREWVRRVHEVHEARSAGDVAGVSKRGHGAFRPGENSRSASASKDGGWAD